MNSVTQQKKLAYNAREAAEALSLSAATIWRLVRDQRIEFCRIGTSVRFTPDQLKSYLDSVAVKKPRRGFRAD